MRMSFLLCFGEVAILSRIASISDAGKVPHQATKEIV